MAGRNMMNASMSKAKPLLIHESPPKTHVLRTKVIDGREFYYHATKGWRSRKAKAK